MALHGVDATAASHEDGKTMAFHSHMLRNTFAIEMLKARLSLEYVSRLLTHSSITTTEKHYAPELSPESRYLRPHCWQP